MKSETLRPTLLVIKALADRQRVRILMLLEPGEICVCQIVEVLSLAPSTVSKHLSLLSAAGLVDSRKVGRWVHYSLPEKTPNPAVGPALEWLQEALRRDLTIARDREKRREVISRDPQVLCRGQKNYRAAAAGRNRGGDYGRSGDADGMDKL